MMTEQIIPQIRVEPLLPAALQGDTDAIERLIDLEVDYQGRWVGYADSTAVWLRVERNLQP